MNNKRGFILLTMLMFIQIYFLLGLTAIEKVLHSEKLNGHKNSRRIAKNEGLLLMRQLEATFNDQLPACFLSSLSLENVRRYEPDSWAAYACSGNIKDFHYDYMIEKLGSDHCALIENHEGRVAVYYRLILRLKPVKHKESDTLLQGIYVKAEKSNESCSDKQKRMKRGLLFVDEI